MIHGGSSRFMDAVAAGDTQGRWRGVVKVLRCISTYETYSKL